MKPFLARRTAAAALEGPYPAFDSNYPQLCWACQELIPAEADKIVVGRDGWLYVYHSYCTWPLDIHKSTHPWWQK